MKVCLGCSERIAGPEWACAKCSWAPQNQDGILIFAPEIAALQESFAGHCFDDLGRLEEGHFWFEARNAVIANAIRKYFPDAASLLEIGCGTGYVLRALNKLFPKIRVSGSELFTEGLAFASQRMPNVDLFQMDARAIPFRDEFDVIGAFDVIEHIDEDTVVLDQMYSAVRSGGGIVITVPQHAFLWSEVDDYSFHKRRYSRAQLVAKVRATGFVVEYATSFVTLLLPALLFSRLRKKSSQPFDPTAEFRISRRLNTLLKGVMNFEAAISRRLPLPVGGSLLVVGRKR